MSKVIRSAKPASAADLLRADHAGARARQHGAHRQARGLLEADHAAVRLRQMRRRAHAEPGEPFAEPLDIALHHRAEIGVHHRGRHALELAELGRDLVPRRRRRPRGIPPRGCARRVSSCSVRTKPYRKQTATACDAGLAQAARRRAERRFVERRSRPCRRGARAPAPPGAGRATPAPAACRPAGRRGRAASAGRSPAGRENPSVVIRPVCTPRCWISALVATVVPWPK